MILLSDIYIIVIYLLRILYPYKPFLDDHIQYNVYSLHPEPLKTVFIEAGTFTTRPAANFLDIALYSYFGDILYIPYVVFVLLYLAFVLILRRVLSDIDIKTGSIFMVIALLCPVNIEGTVWVSAATRIVAGMFFSVASGWMLIGSITALKKICFWITNLISCMFYEQTIVFMYLLIVLISYRKKLVFPAVVAALNVLLTACFYFAFRNYGVFSHRLSSLSFPDIGYFFNGLLSCCRSLVFVFVQNKILYALPVGVVVAVYASKNISASGYNRDKMLLGILIASLCFVPVMITGEYNIPFRYLAVPLIGIALVTDCVKSVRLSKALCIILISVFVSASFAEFNNLDKSTQTDKLLINEIGEIASLNRGKTIAIHGAKSYYTDTPSNHAEHIMAVTSSDWAITGAMRAWLENPYFPMIKLESSADINIFLTEDGTRVDMVR